MHVPHRVAARAGLALLALVIAGFLVHPAQASRSQRPRAAMPTASVKVEVPAASGNFLGAEAASGEVAKRRLSEAEARQIVLEAAYAELGKPYKWGGTGPNRWDCSGLTRHAWAQAGVRIPRVSRWQWRELPHVPLSEARPGDLVFFGKPRIHHVGIYLGPNRMLHAFKTGDFVKISGFVREFVGVARPPIPA